MGRKIRMTLDPISIEAAARELRDYAERLREAEDSIRRGLIEIAAETASERFNEDVTVSMTDNSVLASGESVVFQEFGAGARISDPYPGGTDADIEIRRGAYSDIERLVGPNGEMGVGEYARTGYQYWHHNGERYEYTTPVSGLFYGMMDAQEKEAEVAREVLSEI